MEFDDAADMHPFDAELKITSRCQCFGEIIDAVDRRFVDSDDELEWFDACDCCGAAFFDFRDDHAGVIGQELKESADFVCEVSDGDSCSGVLVSG